MSKFRLQFNPHTTKYFAVGKKPSYCNQTRIRKIFFGGPIIKLNMRRGDNKEQA